MPPFEDDRVRIELCEVVTVKFGGPGADMVVRHAAEVWPFDDGKAKRGKPHVRLIAETRPALLRMLADWIETNNDPSLRGLIAAKGEAETKAASNG